MTPVTPAQVEALIDRMSAEADLCRSETTEDIAKLLDEAASALAALRDENAEQRTLLKVAKCPSCDGSGGVPHQIGPDEWEQQQCQWCDERNTLLKWKD